MSRKNIGSKGEDLAAEFLKRKGFRILQRNYSIKAGEIDIIAQKGEELVFVEVKTDTTGKFGPPEGWVTPRKQKQLTKMAKSYIQRNNVDDFNFRFDVISVSLGKETRIKHIEDAFWASY